MWLALPSSKLEIVGRFAWAPRRNAQAYRLIGDLQQPSAAGSVRG
jgi:hypothetical protein